MPLYQLIHLLPLDSGRSVMRALRQGVKVTCVLRSSEGGHHHILIGRWEGKSVETAGHGLLAPPLVDEFVALLVTLLPAPATLTNDDTR